MVVRIRSILAFAGLVGAVVTVMGNVNFAQDNVKAGNVGGKLVIKMTGDLAQEYAKRTGPIREEKVDSGFEIQAVATIVEKANDGQLGIQHTSYVHLEGKLAKLVTLTGNVNPSRFTTYGVPKGTITYENPGPNASTRTTADSTILQLEVSDLKGLKLRTWSISDEIGE